ncbi:MAG: hypothetical protein KBG62_03845 [Propionivibrio sp.]|nr:hypothetical protein [Propionivibrio sp.]
MSTEFFGVLNALQKGESATYPQAALARRLALLLLIAGNDHAASSRLARHRARTPCGHVQLRFLGSISLQLLRNRHQKKFDRAFH